MQHLTLKAVAPVTTDEGVFEAVISTADVDRERDVVDPDAMVRALSAWTTTNKLIPLAWNHGSDPEDVVGHIDPETVRRVDDEVVAGGQVDLDTPRGREVWGLAKSGTLGFSFGYLATDIFERPDGIRVINGLDVFEITATSTPMNAGTRVLSTKAAMDEHDRLRDRVSRDMYELLTAPLAPGETKAATAEAKRSTPVTIKSYPVE